MDPRSPVLIVVAGGGNPTGRLFGGTLVTTPTPTNPGLVGLALEIQRLSDPALARQYALLHSRRELRQPDSVGEHRYRLIREELKRRMRRCA